MRLNRRRLLQAAGAAGLAAGVARPFSHPAEAQAAVTGRILFARANGLWVWQNDDATQILKRENLSDPSWSPDGTQIAVIESGNSYSNLMIFNPGLNTLTQVTYNQPDLEEGTLDYVNNTTWAADVDWSRSGVIGFLSDYGAPGSAFQLWLVSDPAAGAYQAPLAQFEYNVDSLSMSADGSLAAYAAQERLDDGTSITRAYLRDLSDGVAYPLAESMDAVDPSIAPAMQQVAISIRDDSGNYDIALVDRATGELTQVTQGMQAFNPAWSPDGAWLAYVRTIDYEFEVWASPMVGDTPGEPIKLFKARDFDARSGISWAN